MNKNAKTILSAAGAATAGLAVSTALSYATTRRLVALALDRDGGRTFQELPAARRFLRGFEDTEEFLQRLQNGAEALQKQPTHAVSIRAADGTKLLGHWYPSSQPRRLLLAMHGWRSSWCRDFGLIADFWQREGCSVLFAEQRGQGGSGGAFMGFGLTERFDCLDWAHWLSQIQSQDLPIYLTGVSMGAATVLMASDLAMPENVRGVIADCGFTSPHAIWKHVAEKNLHLSFGLRGRMAEGICRRKLQQGSRDFSAPRALQNTRLPVLLIHGAKDHFVPVEMTYENYEACAGEKQLFIVPGADHGMSYFKDPQGYETAMRSFWQQYDSPTPAQ